MTRFLTGLVVGLLLAVGFTSIASDIRLEAAGGSCQHRLAPDASWSYREWGDYQTKMRLKPNCYQVGLSWLPWQRGATRYGIRIGYVDLGRIKADNEYPVDEQAYFIAKETRTPVNSATARFQGTGGSRGFTAGFAAETPMGAFHIGPEIGMAMLYARWHVQFPGFGAAVASGCREDWACADGWHATWYVGATARYQWLFVSYRRYMNVYTSQSEKNPLFVGPTTGPVDQVLVGISVPL